MDAASTPSKIPVIKAIHSGRMQIGGWIIPCHVLEDERRVITQRSFLEMIQFKGRGNDLGHRMTYFLDHPRLNIPKFNELVLAIKAPILFAPKGGPAVAYGFEGDIVVKYCDAILKARRLRLVEGESFERYCNAAEILLSSVASVGIVALIDEATGYQRFRPRHALQEILDKYLRQHWAQWAKRFPDDFYQQMFRLKNWDWDAMKLKKPMVVGHYTNDLVYKRLAPGVLDELRKRNPIVKNGKRQHKHHQWLTDDIGHPALTQHIHTLTTLMRLASDWQTLKRMVDKAFPKIGETYLLALGEDIPLAD